MENADRRSEPGRENPSKEGFFVWFGWIRLFRELLRLILKIRKITRVVDDKTWHPPRGLRAYYSANCSTIGRKPLRRNDLRRSYADDDPKSTTIADLLIR